MLGYEAMVGVIILSIMISGLVIRSRKPQVPVWSIMAFTSVNNSCFWISEVR